MQYIDGFAMAWALSPHIFELEDAPCQDGRRRPIWIHHLHIICMHIIVSRLHTVRSQSVSGCMIVIHAPPSRHAQNIILCNIDAVVGSAIQQARCVCCRSIVEIKGTSNPVRTQGCVGLAAVVYHCARTSINVGLLQGRAHRPWAHAYNSGRLTT